MSRGFTFPSQLWVLLDDDDEPLHRFEGMQIAPVDQRLIDRWQRDGMAAGDVELFENKSSSSRTSRALREQVGASGRLALKCSCPQGTQEPLC